MDLYYKYKYSRASIGLHCVCVFYFLLLLFRQGIPGSSLVCIYVLVCECTSVRASVYASQTQRRQAGRQHAPAQVSRGRPATGYMHAGNQLLCDLKALQRRRLFGIASDIV